MRDEKPDLEPERLLRLRDLVSEALQLADAADLDMLAIHLHEALLNVTQIIERAEREKDGG